MHTGKHLLTSEKNKQKATDQKHVCSSGEEKNTPLLRTSRRTQGKIRKKMFKEQPRENDQLILCWNNVFRSGAENVGLGVKMSVL